MIREEHRATAQPASIRLVVPREGVAACSAIRDIEMARERQNLIRQNAVQAVQAHCLEESVLELLESE